MAAVEGAEANQTVGKKPKKKNLIWYIAGGGLALLVTVVFFVRKSNSAASTSSTAQPSSSGLDPNTLAALQAMGLLNGGTNNASVGATGPQGPAGPAGPTGPSGGTTGTSGGDGTPVTFNTPNGNNGWMTVSFPSQSAWQTFMNAVGITTGNGYYYYPTLNNTQWTTAVNTAGGTIQNPNQTTGVPNIQSATTSPAIAKAKANSTTTASASPIVKVPDRSRGPYTVRSGQSLSDVARMFGTSVETLRMNNRGVIGYNNGIYPGMRLMI